MNILVIRIFHIYALVTYVFHIWLYLTLTKRSGDFEKNPGPKSNSAQSCVFFVNGNLIEFLCIILSKYPFQKLILSHTNWMLYVYLDSSISGDDDNLEIPGYDLFRADHPSNTKRDVFVFIIETLFP